MISADAEIIVRGEIEKTGIVEIGVNAVAAFDAA